MLLCYSLSLSPATMMYHHALYSLTLLFRWPLWAVGVCSARIRKTEEWVRTQEAGTRAHGERNRWSALEVDASRTCSMFQQWHGRVDYRCCACCFIGFTKYQLELSAICTMFDFIISCCAYAAVSVSVLLKDIRLLLCGVALLCTCCMHAIICCLISLDCNSIGYVRGRVRE